jgi:hypothetical protein
MKLMECIRIVLLAVGICQLTSCSTSPPVAQAPRFGEEEAADFIARYYSDGTSYALKPAMMDGPYRSIFDRASLLNLARQQPRHALAVVVLIHYPGVREEDATKLGWVNDLKGLGYLRVVFLRGGNSMRVNGLPMLECPQASVVFAGK